MRFHFNSKAGDQHLVPGRIGEEDDYVTLHPSITKQLWVPDIFVDQAVREEKQKLFQLWFVGAVVQSNAPVCTSLQNLIPSIYLSIYPMDIIHGLATTSMLINEVVFRFKKGVII